MRKFFSNNYLLISTLILLFICLIIIGFSIYPKDFMPNLLAEIAGIPGGALFTLFIIGVIFPALLCILGNSIREQSQAKFFFITLSMLEIQNNFEHNQPLKRS